MKTNEKTVTLKRPRLDRDVVPFSEYRRSLSVWLSHAADTHRPVVITQNGRATGVMMNVADFERTWDEIEALRAREELARSVEISRREFEEGKCAAAEDVFKEMEAMLRNEDGK